MPVRQLGRIADRLRRHGGQTEIENLLARFRRQDDPEAQLGEKSEPERIMLENVEHPRDADDAARRVRLGQRRIIEQPPVFPGVDIGHGLRVLVGRAKLARAPLAAVARHETPSVGKAVQRQPAMVAAALAAQMLRLDAQGPQRRGFQRMAAAFGHRPAGRQQGRAVCPHEPGDVGTEHLPLQQPLHDPQQGVVHEGTALHQHPVAQLVGAAQPQHLVQGIAYHGIAQARRDVPDLRPFLLGLLDLGIHEDRAARPQIHRMPGKERRPHEFLHAQIEALGERLQKGPASGRTGFIEGHARDATVPGLEALHVLPADVDDVGRLRHEAAGGLEVGDGLHFRQRRSQRRLCKGRAVTGAGAVLDPGPFRQRVRQIGHIRQELGQRIPLIAAIPGGDDRAFPVGQHGLDRGGAQIDPQIERAPRLVQRTAAHRSGRMTLPKGLVFLLAFKKRRQRGRALAVQRPRAGALGQLFHPQRRGLHGPRLPRQRHKAQCRTARNDILRVRYVHDLFRLQLQRLDESLPQGGKEMQRPAQKSHSAPYGMSAGQPADGLFHHGLEDGGRQILARRPFIEQRHHVRLGEHPAARGNGIDGRMLQRQLIEARRIRMQQHGHLIDEGPCPPGAGLVHAQVVRAVGEVQDFGVLAAQFHRHVRLRRKHRYGPRRGQHFLHEGQFQRLRQLERGRTRDGGPHLQTGIFGRQLVQKGAKGRAYRRAMPLVARLQQIARRIHQRQLDRSGTGIQSQIEHGIVHVRQSLPPQRPFHPLRAYVKKVSEQPIQHAHS